MTKKISTTPTATIARALRSLGLVQGLDFRVHGVYVNGERTRTVATIFGVNACTIVRQNDAAIQVATAKAGNTFRVHVYAPGDVTVQN